MILILITILEVLLEEEVLKDSEISFTNITLNDIKEVSALTETYTYGAGPKVGVGLWDLEVVMACIKILL